MTASAAETVGDRQALIEEFNALHAAEPPLPPDGDYDAAACAAERSALCLSGGGIRSAAFSIGVLEALAGRRLLSCFDYVSTVSGGGFAGAWLQRLVLESGGVPQAEDELRRPHGPAALGRLRAFTNYLTPQVGLFSADTWTGFVLYLRNMLLNWLAFIPFFIFAVLAAIFYRTALWAVGTGWLVGPVLLAAAFCLGWGAYHACIMLPSHAARPADPDDINRHCTLPVLLWAVLAPAAATLGWAVPAAWAVAMVLAYLVALRNQRLSGDAYWTLFRRNFGIWVGATLFSTVFIGLGLVLLARAGNDYAPTLAVLGPVWLVTASVLHTGLFAGFREDSRPRNGDLDREWMARLSAMKLRFALAWAGFTVCCLWLSWYVIDRHAGHGYTPFWALAINTAVSGPVAAWLGKQAFTRLEGFTQRSGGVAAGLSFTPVLQLLSGLFAVGLFALLGGGLGWLLGQVQVALGVRSVIGVVLLQALLAGLVIGIGWFQARRLNVNRFSMHAIYRNRLARAFMGSARRERQQDPFTGFDAGDSLPLSQLAPAGGKRKLFPVVNMALNLTVDPRTEWAERKAASFTATPLRCGSPVLDEGRGRYASTVAYAGNEFPAKDIAPGEALGLTLATAMTISGAAVSPNSGYHSSPATAFLMTLFNVRLGAWLPNPATVTEPKDLDLAMPRHALRAMLGDLFGQTRATSKAVYLSDGGHFDNLGLYEMLRRRCRLIVVVDAGQDAQCLFEDLGNAIRKAQIDLPGVRVEMGPLRLRARAAADGPSPLGFALGTIAYTVGADRAERRFEGRLLYVKPSWLEVMPADVRAYGLRSQDFPHESTADQWFTESQFESYRALGAWQVGRIAEEAAEGKLMSLFDAAATVAEDA